MQLKKINQDHYVVVTDEPIKEGDWFIYSNLNTELIIPIQLSKKGEMVGTEKKVTYSTKPIECKNARDVKIIGEHTMIKEWLEFYFDKIKPLDLSYIKSLVGEVDVEKMVDEKYKYVSTDTELRGMLVSAEKRGYVDGYNQCLEDNKDKRFSEKDMRKAIFMAREDEHKIDVRHPNEIISSLTQPKDTWEVEFDENNNLKLK